MGNNQAKAWLYRRYVPILLGVCRRYINDRMEAEDLVHESFIAIFDKIADLKQNEALEAWMKKIVVNNALKALKAKIHFSDLENLKEPESESSDELHNESTRQRVQKLELSQLEMLSIIDSLPPGFKTVFNLYVFENLSHNEIAEELGISAGTSRSQLVRARKMIQKKLIEKVEQEEKSNKKKKTHLATLLLVMNDDLLYIDQFVASKLKGINIVPSTSPDFLKAGNTPQGIEYLKSVSKPILFSGKNLIWTSAILLGGVGTALIFFVGKNENKHSQEPVMYKEAIDSLALEKKPDTLFLSEPKIDTLQDQYSTSVKPAESAPVLRDTTITKEVVLKKKVVMRKVIAVKKEKIVTDTIRKTDTLPKNQDSISAR